MMWFVYGTLRPTGRLYESWGLSDIPIVCENTIARGEMWSVGAFPLVRFADGLWEPMRNVNQSLVVGAVFDVPDGDPSWASIVGMEMSVGYVPRLIAVRLANGTVKRALAFDYQGAPWVKAVRVESGDWFNRPDAGTGGLLISQEDIDRETRQRKADALYTLQCTYEDLDQAERALQDASQAYELATDDAERWGLTSAEIQDALTHIDNGGIPRHDALYDVD